MPAGVKVKVPDYAGTEWGWGGGGYTDTER